MEIVFSYLNSRPLTVPSIRNGGGPSRHGHWSIDRDERKQRRTRVVWKMYVPRKRHRQRMYEGKESKERKMQRNERTRKRNQRTCKATKVVSFVVTRASGVESAEGKCRQWSARSGLECLRNRKQTRRKVRKYLRN